MNSWLLIGTLSLQQYFHFLLRCIELVECLHVYDKKEKKTFSISHVHNKKDLLCTCWNCTSLLIRPFKHTNRVLSVFHQRDKSIPLFYFSVVKVGTKNDFLQGTEDENTNPILKDLVFLSLGFWVRLSILSDYRLVALKFFS